MSSPIERVPSSDSASLRAPRKAGSSSSSLSSLPSRLAQPPASRPSTAEVQLDLSSASSENHASASRRPPNDLKSKPALPTVAPSGSIVTVSPKACPRTSIIESSHLWKTSAAKRAEKSWALQTERALYSDAKFKKYLALIERTLASFDNVSEWADFISFLARLHKAIQAYPAYNVIPRKLIVAKRLAQCLNPALPSGVHQRALDVFHHILSVIGPDGLLRDLHVWTSALLPFFQYASTSVKPTLLAIYESFYLPLQHHLRPLTKALQMALLPGLEEDTSEYYERTLGLLDKISHAVTPPFFLQNLWLTLITTPSVRLATLNYLARRMPPVHDHHDPTTLVGKDLGLMVRGLAHALDDHVLLVRRNTLDMLVTHLQIDKPLFRSFIKPPDQILLVRSALNVVLRRDLSLNRRLYTWLLGPDETSERQSQFLRHNGLHLVRSALKQGFDDAELEPADRQKPYRIFVSLLDKWEIGQSLTRVLALDAFLAISLQVAKAHQEELMTTAKMLFEVIDPFLLYANFFDAIVDQFQKTEASSKHSPLALLCFVLKAFHIHDEETKQIHVPLLFGAVSHLLHRQLSEDASDDVEAVSALDALELLKLLVTVMPSRVFVRIASAAAVDEPAPRNHFLQRARSFYASSETDSQQAARHFVSFQHTTSATALVQLFGELCLVSARRAAEATMRIETFVRALDVFADVMRVVDGSEAQEEIALVGSPARVEARHTQKLRWDAAGWVAALLPHLDIVTTFAQAERIVEVLISCCICRALETRVRLDAPSILDRIVSCLLGYLAPTMSPYHVRAVELLWATHKVIQTSRLETAMMQQLSRGSDAARSAALVAFGTFWRLSEDVSTDELRTPLLFVLDKLQCLDVEERQQAEVWLRTNLRSYTKVVDPLVHMLLRNRPARIESAAVEMDGIRVAVSQIDEPFNAQLVLYAFRTLAALARFGGANLAKALATTPLSTSFSTATKKLIRAEMLDASCTYLDVVLDECSVWIGAYPSAQLKPSYESAFPAMRAAAVDVMHCFVQRTSSPSNRMHQLETLVIENLLVAVHQNTTSVQNKMLHTLHTILAAKTGVSGRPELLQRRFSSTSLSPAMHQRAESTGRSETDGDAGSPHAASKSTPSAPSPRQPHRLLLTLLQRGLATPSNRPIMQHWSDFILMTAPLYRTSIQGLLLPLNHTACDLIANALDQVSSSYVGDASRPTFGAELVVPSHDTPCSLVESDLLLLINLAERSLMLATDSSVETQLATRNGAVDNVPTTPASLLVAEKTHEGAPGLLGYVSNVFASDVVADAERSSGGGKERHSNLVLTVETLHRVWTVCGIEVGASDAKWLSLDAMKVKVKLRCRRAFERIYRAHAAETVESLLHCWQASTKCGRTRGENASQAVVEILDIVTPSVQILVSFVCDVLGARIARSDAERARKMAASTATATSVSDATLFLFFDAVLARMEPQEAIQVWPVVIVFVKEFVANAMTRKVHVYRMLRMFTALAEKICVTSAMDDRRTKRELHENFAKLIDSCILIAGRSFDHSTWMRRSGRDQLDELDKEAGEFASELLSLEDEPGTDANATNGVVDAIKFFIATRGLRVLRRMQMDADRVQTIVANAVYYIVAPVSRSRSGRLEVDAGVVAVVSELVRMPGTVKVWRSTVAELFGDGRFFSMSLVKAERWKPIVLALMTQDKERMVDLLARVSASATAANIFANRELEMVSRALNLRRLSFTIFSGEQDTFLTQLPLIQEKLVEVLRSTASEVLHSEVYLCVRVLLVRFSARNLAGFWPVLMTELMRLYDQVAMQPEMVDANADGRNLVLSTLKLVDLLVVLQPEDFQIHEWMFITDTIDAVYPTDDFEPETLLDHLSTTLQTQTQTQTRHAPPPSPPPPPPHTWACETTKKQLQLARSESIHSTAELVPFLNRVSQSAFEANYSDKRVDWDHVEQCLLADMFDGGGDGTDGVVEIAGGG